MTTVYSLFIIKNMLDMYIHPYETQANEIINNIIAILAPK